MSTTVLPTVGQTDGQTALQLACRASQLATVICLLKHDASLDLTDVCRLRCGAAFIALLLRNCGEGPWSANMTPWCEQSHGDNARSLATDVRVVEALVRPVFRGC